MISSNTRASRSASRYSSPAQPAGGNWSESKGRGNEGSRALMARWLEPSVQTKPSFEEAGLMRYGVLENMAPLGTMPRPKKPGAETGSAVRRIILRPSGAGLASAAREAGASADHATPGPRSPPGSSPPRSSPPPPPPPPPPPTRPPAPVDKETAAADEHDEAKGKGGTGRRRSKRVSLPAKKMRRQTPEPEAKDAAAVATTPTPKATSPKKRQAPLEPRERDFTDKVVEAAVDEALKHYRYPTAWAMRTLYDEKCDDAEFVAMIADVFRQTADAETRDEFRRLIEDKKREGKRHEQGYHYFVPPPASNNRFTRHEAKPGPYTSLLCQGATGTGEGEGRAAKRARTWQTAAASSSSSSSSLSSSSSSSSSSPSPPSKTAASMTTAKMTMTTTKAASTAAAAATAATAEGVEIVVVGGGGRGGNGGTPRSSSSRSRRHQHQQHARRDSGSSTSSSSSSLSSAMSLAWPEAGGASPSPSTRGADTDAAGAPKCQPITSRGKRRASSRRAASNTSESNTGTHHRRHASSTADDAASMPGRLAASELFPNVAAKKHGSTMADGDEDPFWDRRRDARRATAAYSALESSMRTGLGRQRPAATPPPTTRRTRPPPAAPVSTRATRSASKRPAAADAHDRGKRPATAAAAAADALDRSTSPAAFSWQGDGSPVTAAAAVAAAAAAASSSSRAATPPMLRPAKRQRTGLRVKTSPVKKKGGTAAGVPRSMSEANSTLNNGVPKDATSDNDEYCSACGNAGDVVCCDGCPRSFHFECVDMVQSDNLPDEWYCNECLIRRFPSRVPVHKGIFASALNNLEKSIPRAFSLPKKVQNRFEGVKAGADGDYEDVAATKVARKRNGYDELPDFFKQRDDGRPVLCHACQKPAAESRAIIPCSACPFHWHTDCLDPPLAVPPVLKTWRCPAHVDDILIHVPGLAPAHRFRRVKGAAAIAPALSRGLRNNGHIEIDWTDEPDASGWPDPSSFGRNYKLPAKGVVLDFIEQLRHRGAGYGSRRHEPRRIPYPSPSTQRDASTPLPGSALERDLDEMQVSLTLVGLRQRPSEPIDRLTSALISAADENVMSLMAKSNADNIAVGRLTQDDKQGLRALLAQIDAMGARVRQVLGEDKPAPEAAVVSADARTPVSEPPGIGESSKLDLLAPVAEPTPPSTVDHAEGSMELD